MTQRTDETSPPDIERRITLMGRARKLMTLTALAVLGLAEIARAGQFSPGPQFCPFFADFLTPSLFDVLFSPGGTFRE